MTTTASPSRDDGTVAEPGAERDPGARDLSALASGWMLTLLGVVSSAAFGFALSVIVARGLGARGAGVFFATSAVFVIATVIAEFGAGTGVVRTLARLRALERHDEIRGTLATALVPPVLAALVIGAGLWVFAPEISRAILAGPHQEAGVPYLRALAPFLPFSVGFNVVISATRGLGSIRAFVAIQNLGVAPARAVLALLVVAAGLGGAVFAAAWALPLAVGLVVAAFALRRQVDRVGRVGRAAEAAEATGESSFWRFTAPLGVAVVLQVVLLWLDTILLAALASPREAGIYKTTGSVILQGTFAQTAIVLVIGPLLSKLLARDEHGRAQSVYQTATWWITALAWPVYLTLALFAPLLLRMFGPAFVEGATAMRILALTMLVATAAGPATAALVMSGRSGWNLVNIAVAVALNAVINVLLIPPLGMTGAAIAWSVSIVVSNVAPGMQLWRFAGLYAFGTGFRLVAAATVGCYGVLGLLVVSVAGTELVALVGFAAVATLIYAAILWRSREALQLGVLRESLRLRRGATAHAG